MISTAFSTINGKGLVSVRECSSCVIPPSFRYTSCYNYKLEISYITFETHVVYRQEP